MREAGLEDHEPRFVWNPLDPAPTGLAYGHFGRYSVALTGGLVTRQIADPPAFDAVVRHELAHIRNRDVDTTYITLAIWYAFLATAVVPFVLTLLDEGAETIARVSWRLAALALLVYLTRNAVLRSREVYADVRASIHDGRDGGLRRVLAGLPAPAAGWAGRLRRLHPDPAVRLRALDDTRPLFRFGPLVAFGSGVAATIAYENVVTLVSFFDLDPIDMRFIAALAFAPFAAGIVGYAIWRATFAATADGRPGIPTLRLGLALAAGFLLGPELSLAQTAATDDDALLASLIQGEDLLWGVALVVGLALFTGWLAAVAAYWLRSLRNRTPQVASALSLLAAAAVLSVFMAVFYIARDTREIIDASAASTKQQHAEVAETAWAGPVWLWQALMDPAFLVVVHRPFILPALVLVWAVPLAAAFWRGRSGGGRRLGVPRARRRAAPAVARPPPHSPARGRPRGGARLLGAGAAPALLAPQRRLGGDPRRRRLPLLVLLPDARTRTRRPGRRRGDRRVRLAESRPARRRARCRLRRGSDRRASASWAARRSAAASTRSRSTPVPAPGPCRGRSRGTSSARWWRRAPLARWPEGLSGSVSAPCSTGAAPTSSAPQASPASAAISGRRRATAASSARPRRDRRRARPGRARHPS